MDAYEIRLELLKLAQSIESERIWGERQRLEQDWNAIRESRMVKDIVPPPFPVLPVTTFSDIVTVAEELNKFVSNKG